MDEPDTRERRGRAAGTAALLVGLTTLSALLLELRERLPFNSDQGIIALTALDILKKGAHPVFCYGSEYGGTLEAHYLALAFGLFSPTVLTFRLATGVLVCLTVLAVWRAGRLAFGERAGLLAGLYLAVGPSYFLYKGLTSDGAYASLMLIAALSLLLLLHVDRRAAAERPFTPLAAGLGFLWGLAWWIHPVSVCFSFVALAALAASRRPRLWVSPAPVLALAGGFLFGGIPWWAHNVRTGFLSLKAPELAAAGSARLGERVGLLFQKSWPILLGGRGLATDDPELFPGAFVLALLALLAFVLFALSAIRRNLAPGGRLAAAAALALIVSITVLALTARRTDFKEPRYLVIAYAGLALLAGGLVGTQKRPRNAVLLAVPLAALNLGSQIGATRLKGLEGTDIRTDTNLVMRTLEGHGVTNLYTPYWVAYRVSFLSRGRIAATPFGPGELGFTRHAGLRDAVDRSAAPAFLLGPEEAVRLRAYLVQRRAAHVRTAVDGFTLFTGLPPEAVAPMRACRCIPPAPARGGLTWLGAAGPAQMEEGSTAVFSVSVRNGSPVSLSPETHLSYHWLRPDGTEAHHDGLRTELDDLPPPRAAVGIPARVVANVPPGEYDLVFDFVVESVAWFQDLGVAPTAVRVRVTPKAR